MVSLKWCAYMACSVFSGAVCTKKQASSCPSLGWAAMAGHPKLGQMLCTKKDRFGGGRGRNVLGDYFNYFNYFN